MRSVTSFNGGWLFEGEPVSLPHNAVDLPFAYFDERRYQRPFAYSTSITHFHFLPSQRRLGEIDVAEAQRYQHEGHFPEGSMGPKVRAATQFLQMGGAVAVVSTPELAAPTLDPPGNEPGTDGGTRIVPTRESRRVAS